jgi:hypothetical protein
MACGNLKRGTADILSVARWPYCEKRLMSAIRGFEGVRGAAESAPIASVSESIERVTRRTLGPEGEQYSLRAIRPGS